MKTQEEIEALKKDWLADPVWDLEDTEGFEEHAIELMNFRLEKEAEWTSEHLKKIQRKQAKWFDLKLNEKFTLDDFTTVLRVPGGWIVDKEADHIATSVFVPFSAENI